MDKVLELERETLSALDAHEGGVCAGRGWCDYCDGVLPEKEGDE